MWKVNLSNERVGSVNKNNYGSLMEVVKYNSYRDIWVKFLEFGNLKHTSWGHFCNGRVLNVYDKSIYGVGYIGEGKYKFSENGKQTPQSNSWVNMMIRCYSEKEHERNPKYKDCTVAEEWHCFQNFAKWYDENFYQVEGERMQLDKDILVKGNKIYSPDTCIFTPMRINILFAKRDSKRGEFPIGVARNNKKFQAHCSNISGRKEVIGIFETIEESFNAYKSHKENYIKEVAEEYKNQIPLKLYNAMLNYIVEIDD
jgi:hypothetical protein